MKIGSENYRIRRNRGKFEFNFKPVTPDNRHACLGGPSAKFRAGSPGHTRALEVTKWSIRGTPKIYITAGFGPRQIRKIVTVISWILTYMGVGRLQYSAQSIKVLLTRQTRS